VVNDIKYQLADTVTSLIDNEPLTIVACLPVNSALPVSNSIAAMLKFSEWLYMIGNAVQS